MVFHVASLAKGYLVAGQLEILEKKSSGERSHIYLAKDRDLNRDVVIKIYTVEVSFKKEIRSLQALRHTNIISLEDVYEPEVTDDWYPYFIAAFEQGRYSLQDFINRVPNIPINNVKIIVADIVNALQALQEKNIVHTDLKPSNVLYFRDEILFDHWKLMDFDASCHVGEEVDRGTIGYIAPEVIRGLRANETPLALYSIDMFALGRIVQRLTGFGEQSLWVGLTDDASETEKEEYLANQTEILIDDRTTGDSTRSFIRGLIVKDPYKRATLDRVQNSPFLTGNVVLASSDSENSDRGVKVITRPKQISLDQRLISHTVSFPDIHKAYNSAVDETLESDFVLARTYHNSEDTYLHQKGSRNDILEHKPNELIRVKPDWFLINEFWQAQSLDGEKKGVVLGTCIGIDPNRPVDSFSVFVRAITENKEKGGEPGEKFKLSYNEGEVLKIRYTSSPTWEAINERGWQGKVNAYNFTLVINPYINPMSEIFCGYEVGQRNRKFVLQGRPRISLSAAVWKAYKVHSKNVVAVKFCNDRSRFQRQVKILRALSSKSLGYRNIVHMHMAFVSTKESPWYPYDITVMDYMVMHLHEFLIKTGSSLQRQHFHTIRRDITAGLYCCHQCNIVHCDIRPNNIMLYLNSRNEERWCLVGFEHAHFLNEPVQLRPGVTVHFLSPEVILANEPIPAHPSQDIWSLGLIFLFTETYNEKNLWPDEKAVYDEELVDRLREDYEDIEDLHVRLNDAELQQVIEGMLRKNPNKRLQLSEINFINTPTTAFSQLANDDDRDTKHSRESSVENSPYPIQISALTEKSDMKSPVCEWTRDFQWTNTSNNNNINVNRGIMEPAADRILRRVTTSPADFMKQAMLDRRKSRKR